MRGARILGLTVPSPSHRASPTPSKSSRPTCRRPGRLHYTSSYFPGQCNRLPMHAANGLDESTVPLTLRGDGPAQL
jgi:hypothetical protein